MAPHDIVYTTHIITAMLSKARGCYLSRQQYYEGFKFYVETAEDNDKMVQRLEAAAQEDKTKHQEEKDHLTATVDQLRADLFHSMEDAEVNAYELEKAEDARKQYKQDSLRTQRLRTSEDRVTYHQANLANRYGERLQEVAETLENKTAELNELSDELIRSRDQVADLLSASGEYEDERNELQKEIKRMRVQYTTLEEKLKAANQRVRDLEENHQQDMVDMDARIQDIERLEDEIRVLRSREPTETRGRANAPPTAAAAMVTARYEERPSQIETPFLPTRQGSGFHEQLRGATTSSNSPQTSRGTNCSDDSNPETRFRHPDDPKGINVEPAICRSN